MSDRKQHGVTRRALFKGAGIAAASGAVLGPLDALARDEARTLQVPVQGPGPVQVRMRLNGSEKVLEAEPRHTLLDALRGPLGLTGAKPVCDRGQCGACTVMLDGETVYACTVLAVEAEGRSITTVEGLGTPQSPHALQSAFVQEDGLQCGFCTPGMVVSCAWALQQHGKDLSEAQAREATAGNLCRCGTYPHVLRAAVRAAKEA